LVALGCGHGSSPSEPARRDAISLVSISPAEGSVLPYGDTADVTVRVRYSFASAARGKIGLTAYRGDQVPVDLFFTDPLFLPVEGREGEATLRSKVYFNLFDPLPPKGSTVTLDLSLFPEGIDRTSIAFQVHYQLGS